MSVGAWFEARQRASGGVARRARGLGGAGQPRVGPELGPRASPRNGLLAASELSIARRPAAKACKRVPFVIEHPILQTLQGGPQQAREIFELA
eukprot:scaffold41383_cov63-Phaeocystis_antarctica.AAC.3